MKCLLLLILTFVLFSCKTPQKVSSVTSQQEQINTVNRISLNTDNSWKEVAEQELTRLINEQLTVKIKQIKYDTDKPVDTLTNRCPIASEFEIIISRSKDTDEKEISGMETTSRQTTSKNDNSETTSEVQTETKESRKTGLNDMQIILMAGGVLAIAGIVVVVIIKLK